MNACGCVVPVRKHIKWCFQLKPSLIVDYESNIDKHFLCAYDEDCTVKFFLDALVRNEFEDAKAYISKNYVTQFDLDELSDYFIRTNNYKLLSKVEFRKPPKNCTTNSIMVIEGHLGNKMSIIHLHMVKEPNKFGKWKIYDIDKE